MREATVLGESARRNCDELVNYSHSLLICIVILPAIQQLFNCRPILLANRMPIVKFTTESPILRRAIELAPESVVEVVDDRATVDGPVKLIFWVESDDFDAFHDGLEADPTIADARLIETNEERRRYRVSYTDEGARETITSVITEQDGSIHDVVVTDRGVWFRVDFPDREALRAVRRWLDDRGRPFDTEAIYERSNTASGGPFNLTEPQREALALAYRSGYFDIPREAQCGEVAAELGISAQALSERLRRGMSKLIVDSDTLRAGN